MADKKITFFVTPGSGIQSYEISVGHDTVPMEDDEGSIILETGRNHILGWTMVGNSGATLGIVGKDEDEDEVVEADSEIAEGEHTGEGVKSFELNE